MSAGFVLRVENGAQAGEVFPLAAPSVVIGRHTEADIVLNGNQVSRRHARLEFVNNQPILTDLNSANGTFVNGSRLATPQPLNSGDLIELGEYRLRVEGPPVASPATVIAPEQDFAATQYVHTVAQEPAQIAAGTILNGRYRLDRSIGQGGFARVFLANDLALKRPIAVKVMNVELVGESSIDDFLTRFANEAQAIANLDHPHILAIHDFGQLGATGFLVMPYVAGGTLADALRSHGRFSPHVASRYLRQVAAALDYAHRRNLVHRDIKPQNMLLRDEDDHLLLADFGIAKVISATSAQSRTGVVGTIAYMAPEQFQGQVSRATDVYALGCVLFQWLTGKLPFGGSTEEVIYGHISAAVPLLAKSGADLPPAAQAVIARALAKRPEDRYASAGELAAAFDAALATPATAQPADAPTVAANSPQPQAAPSSRAVQPPKLTHAPDAAPAATPSPSPADPPRFFNRHADLDRVPERKPAPPPPEPVSTTLTIPAVVVAVLALLAIIAIVVVSEQNASSIYDFVDDSIDLIRIGAVLPFVAIWFVRAAALQRASIETMSAWKGLLRALLLLLPPCGVAALCLSDVGTEILLGWSAAPWSGAMVLAAVSPLVVPNASPTRQVGRALAFAAALTFAALGAAIMPLMLAVITFNRYYYLDAEYDNDSRLLAALACLAGAALAFLLQQIARRLFPRSARWIWILALALIAVSIYMAKR